MPRPMSRPRFAQADQCPGCLRTLTAETPVVLSAGGTTPCEPCSKWIVTARIVARGTYAEIRLYAPTN
jgi:hypothetical protein